ncbi:hypothetical protein NLJ89_g4748 [Agrocybe chaxingu]|uniref:F-box domain-containing protein n=1 Tax=Agrocybe chaxingu TaxID=84603 RepID=A0A9W8K2H0_9AGAR|nr:hypothetical protein NLJ89_g4748 [Agrocybe chaxingu]
MSTTSQFASSTIPETRLPQKVENIAHKLSSGHISLQAGRIPREIESLRRFNLARPIFRLPVELLCDIFTISIQDSTHSRRVIRPTPSASATSATDPTLLGQVCSCWRNAALNLPNLWSTIYIEDAAKSHVFLTQLWLQRAAGQPLNLTILHARDPFSAYQILAAFVAHCHLWKKVNMMLPLDLIPELWKLLRPLNLRCDMLQSVYFLAQGAISDDFRVFDRKNPGWYRRYVGDIWSFFYSSASLRTVVWDGTFSEVSFKDSPFTQLTHVSLRPSENLDAEDMIGLMNLFPNLRSFHATISSPSAYSALKPCIPSTPIVFEYLDALHLWAETPISLTLSHVTLPCLRDLRISSASCQEPIVHLTILEILFRRSQCQLKTLVYEDSKSEQGLLEDLIVIPQLQTLNALKFEGKVFDSAILLFLRKKGSGMPVVMPVLQDVHLGRCDTTDGLLSSMVLSRSTILKEFIFGCKWYGPIDDERLSLYKASRKRHE